MPSAFRDQTLLLDQAPALKQRHKAGTPFFGAAPVSFIVLYTSPKLPPGCPQLFQRFCSAFPVLLVFRLLVGNGRVGIEAQNVFLQFRSCAGKVVLRQLPQQVGIRFVRQATRDFLAWYRRK